MKTAAEILMNGGKARQQNWSKGLYIYLDKEKIIRWGDDNQNIFYGYPDIFQPIWEEYNEPSKWWEPKDGEFAFVLFEDGEIDSFDFWKGQSRKRIVKQGNTFKTQEEAEKESELRKATYRLKKAFFEVCNGENGWVEDACNYFVKVEHGRLTPDWFVTTQYLPSWMHCRTKEQCQKIIENHKEDLLLWFNQ